MRRIIPILACLAAMLFAKEAFAGPLCGLLRGAGRVATAPFRVVGGARGEAAGCSGNVQAPVQKGERGPLRRLPILRRFVR